MLQVLGFSDVIKSYVHLHGTGCLRAQAMDTGFPTVMWRLCLGLGFAVTPPILAGMLGCVCVGVRVLPVPNHQWLGCAVWVCALWLGFLLRRTTPGWGVGVCVCACVRGWARVSAAPRHSWLGCWGVCVLVCALCMYPAAPRWGVRRGCVCLGSVSAALAQLALHNPHIWANSLKPVCFLCFLLFWCPLLPFIETGTLKIYTKMVLYMKNEIFDLKYPLHGV